MGHYDTCREENCGVCGQAKGVVWNCGRERCAMQQQWLKRHYPEDYERLMVKLRAEDDATEERRVTARQIKRRTLQIAAEAKAAFE